MKPFKKGKLYRFSQPGNEDHFFYKNLKSAFDQTGNNAYLPEGGEAMVIYLGFGFIGGEHYHKWLHEDKVVYINFADDCFEEI